MSKISSKVSSVWHGKICTVWRGKDAIPKQLRRKTMSKTKMALHFGVLLTCKKNHSKSTVGKNKRQYKQGRRIF
jgi:hypothetical protein